MVKSHRSHRTTSFATRLSSAPRHRRIRWAGPSNSTRKPRKGVFNRDLDLGCLRSATFAPNQRDSSAQAHDGNRNSLASRRRRIQRLNCQAGANYRRLLSCVRGRRRECASVALAATHCGRNAPTASGDDGFAAHLSRLASLSPGLRSRRPLSRWACREVGVPSPSSQPIA
jgi:hypothetical protein